MAHAEAVKSQITAEPGTPEHEDAVKQALTASVENSAEMLRHLDVVEAREIDIGNSFLAFRFRN